MPKHIDEERNATQDKCDQCGSQLSDAVVVRSRVIEDIPEIKPKVIKYNIERRYCPNCKKMKEVKVAEALPNARFSLKEMQIIGYMKTVERLPVQRVVEMMSDLFGLKVSEGEIMKIVEELSKYFKEEYKEIVESMRKAKARYIDETSWRVDGKNAWVWAFVTKNETIYEIAESRKHDVAAKVMGKHEGVDMHDGFSAYVRLEKETKNPQAWCWAHMIRDAKELKEYNEKEGTYILSILKSVYDKAKEYVKTCVEVGEEELNRLYEEFRYIDTSYESKKCRGFVGNMLKRGRDDLFRFVINREVESTNNRAERAIRPIVTYRKVSGGSRSDKGASNFSIVYTVMKTRRKRYNSWLRFTPNLASNG